MLTRFRHRTNRAFGLASKGQVFSVRLKRNWPKSAGEWWVLLQTVVMYLGVRVLLPRMRLDRILDLLLWLSSRKHVAVPNEVGLQHSVRFVNRLVRSFPILTKGPCLPRSLLLFYFATRFGYPAVLHCGVYRSGSDLEGHAWLSSDGKPFLEKGNPFETYRVTLTFPNLLAKSSPAYL